MPDSLTDVRSAVLARMVDKAPLQKLGRTQVMKLFYFLQELQGVPLGYDFRLFTYGPFDSDVLGDLAAACSLETVVEQTVIYPRGYGYEISLGRHARRLSERLEQATPELASKIDAVVQEFGLLGAAELELRSTIFFIDREVVQAGATTTSRDLAARVVQIKPHFSEATVLDRIGQMRERGWLEGIIPDVAAPIPF
jgi:uncharacterized protein YwgA